MNKFINREGLNLNRKELVVVSIERDTSGEIISLVVDEARCDNDITKEGTKLEAMELNTIVRNMILEELNITDLERVTYDKDALTYSGNITENFSLPLYGEQGSSIDWEVISGTGLSIEDGVGVVTRGVTDQVVTFAAILTFRECTQTKEFTVTIKKIPTYTPESYTTNWNHVAGTYNSGSILINSLNGENLYCAVGKASTAVNISFLKNNTQNIVVALMENQTFNTIEGAGTVHITFSINIYSDSTKTVLIGTIPCTINYKY